MFGKKMKIFTLLGFDVSIDPSWYILAILITWTLAKGVFPHYYKGFSVPVYWLMGFAGALGLFISIVFHEFCHSYVARRYGLQMKGITLFIFGGVAEMEKEPPNPKSEFMMAIAGPLSSILLGAGLYMLKLTILLQDKRAINPTLVVISYLSFINFLLAGFNLVPAFPLDGGRVLRSILWGWMRNLRKATKIASSIGSGFGTFLIILGVLEVLMGEILGGIWWFLIGMFLKNASNVSYKHVIIRKALEGETVSRFMNPNVITVPSNISIEELIKNYIYTHHYKMYPVVEDGRLLGCVTINQVKEVPKEKRETTRVDELANACSQDNTIDANEDAMKALSIMNRLHLSRLMVAEGSKLVGIIALKDIMKLLSLKIDLGEE